MARHEYPARSRRIASHAIRLPCPNVPQRSTKDTATGSHGFRLKRVDLGVKRCVVRMSYGQDIQPSAQEGRFGRLKLEKQDQRNLHGTNYLDLDLIS